MYYISQHDLCLILLYNLFIMPKRLSVHAKKTFRQNIMLRMMLEEPDRKWDSRTLAEKMREVPWVQEFMPNYSHTTAQRDFLAIQEDFKAQSEEFRDAYLKIHMDTTEALVEGLLEDIKTLDEELNSLKSGSIKTDDQIAVMLQILDAKRKLSSEIRGVLKRQSDMIGMDAPKQNRLDINQQSIAISMSSEKFLEMRKQALKISPPKDDDVIIDGEYE